MNITTGLTSNEKAYRFFIELTWMIGGAIAPPIGAADQGSAAPLEHTVKKYEECIQNGKRKIVCMVIINVRWEEGFFGKCFISCLSYSFFGCCLAEDYIQLPPGSVLHGAQVTSREEYSCF